MSQDKPLFEVEVEPPTPEEIERQRVREEYRAKLAEKLKDPEFRKLEGFPVGTDDAILALSDPPYYTACPNPFIEEWLKEHGKPFDPDTDDYHREPFAADVSEGKNHPIYNAHSYHTKVPHRAIMRYILHYTQPGDVVYDGFCGTGMTGVAAQLCADRDEVIALGYRVADDSCIWEKESWEAKQAIEAGRTNPHPHLVEPKPFSKLGARKAFLNDLSPAATFIAYNYNTPVNADAFELEARNLLADVEGLCGWMYMTLHREENRWSDVEWAEFIRSCSDGVSACRTSNEAKNYVDALRERTTLGKIGYVIWSDVYVCPQCSGDIVLWNAAVDASAGKVLEEFPCTHCNAMVSKRKCDRKYESKFDDALQKTLRQSVQVPVLCRYSVGKKHYDKNLDQFDLALLRGIDRLPLRSTLPTLPMMFKGTDWGDTWRSGIHAGVSHVHHFFTRRNLETLACFQSSNEALRRRVQFWRSGAVRYLSRMAKLGTDYYFNGGGGAINAGVTGTLYLPSFSAECSPVETLRTRLPKLVAALRHLGVSDSILQTGSATITVPPGSADYMFIDPPFGGNLMYSELNFIGEAWLGVQTNCGLEAITSSHQAKGLPEYQGLMQSCFERFYSVLKPGRWMTVEFHNSANSVWNSIQEALERVGFVVADVRVLDKGQYSFKQVTSSGATKQDLVISCYKPNARFVERFEQDKGTPEGVREFIEQHLEMLPVAATTSAGNLESLAERTLGMLYDRMLAYHLVRGAKIPLSASEFRILLDDVCYERDGMYFLPSQVVRYDALKSRGIEVEQLSIFVRDEKSAVQWVRNQLEQEPQTLGELTPKFMQASQDWGQHEAMPELRDLLQQYFIREDDETWVVPDPDNEKHLEEVRRKAMLREFMEYVRRPGQLKLFRTEAVLAGFAHCWETKQYDVIVGVCEKIPPKILQEIQDLVMFYDIAKGRVPEKIVQFEFKWE